MTPQRSVRIDVASDITIPIKTSLAVIIARDPLGLDVVERKTIDFIIDYIKPESGYQASSGYTGSTTYTSVRGYTGYQGSAGSTGVGGNAGYQGSAGLTGPQGYAGSVGQTGVQGISGIQGENGYTGSQGNPGSAGQIGFTGSLGPQGYQGSEGIQGFTGSQGNIGFTGSTGPQGTLGITGPVGYTGSQGISFKIIRVPGQSSLVATTTNDTINFVAGTGINITTTTESMTISSTIPLMGLNTNLLRSNGSGGIVSDGNISFNNVNLAVVGNITATGDIISSFSDDRLKTRHGVITDAVQKVKGLNGFYYVNNSLAQDLGIDFTERQVGVSAQEVQAVLPEVVEISPIHDDFLTVNYERLVPLLVEAIKEQSQRLKTLTDKIQDLE